MTEPAANENDSTEDAQTEVVDVSKLKITPKGVAKFFVGSSVKFIVTSSIATLVPVESRKDKAKVLIGGYVISSILADKAKERIGEDIDEKVEFCREVFAKVRELQAQQAETPDEQ